MTGDEVQDSWASIIDDLMELVDNVPSPPDRLIGEWTRKDQTEARAVAVAWGWLMRMKRTSSAVLLLEGANYGVESRPLVRSVIEHAIRLGWGASLEPHVFVEALLRMQKWSLEKTLEAAEKGWPLSSGQVRNVEESIAEASDEFKYLDTFKALANVVATNPREFAGIYQHWLLETQVSHPTMSSAAAYLSANADGLGTSLHHDARPDDARTDVLFPSLLWFAAGAYGVISGLTYYFEEPLNDIGARMAALGVPSREHA
jgi:hypothetical protein